MTKNGGKEDASEKKKVRETPNTKVVIRCLPPTLTEADFLEQISPLPDNNYLSFVKADSSLEANAFCRAYINVVNQEDIFPFRDRWDGYPFVDTKGTAYPAVVEFAPYQKVPKKQCRKVDPRCNSIENDDDFKVFTESLQAEVERLPSAETYLEELEAKLNEKEAQEFTPLLAFLKNKKMEKIKIRQEAREERRRKEHEQKKRDEDRRQKREEERRRQREKQRQREREAKEEKRKVKREVAKEEPQKIKLLTKVEGENRQQRKDSTAPFDGKNKGKKRDQTRQDDREKALQQKDTEKQQEAKEMERERVQQRAKEQRNKGKDSQPRDRRGERRLDRDGGGQEDLGQDRVEETPAAEKGIDLLSKRKLQRDNKPTDSHSTQQTRSGTWQSQKTVKEHPPRVNEKRQDRDKHRYKLVDQSREDSLGRKEKETARSADKRPASGKEAIGQGMYSRDGLAEKSGTSARGKDCSARLRNKDRPTMALYQPGQRPSVVKCQDVKEPKDKTKSHRSSSWDAEAKVDKTRTGSDNKNGDMGSNCLGEGASAKSRGEGKGMGKASRLRDERNPRDVRGKKWVDQRTLRQEVDHTSVSNKPGSSKSSKGESSDNDKGQNRCESDVAKDTSNEK